MTPLELLQSEYTYHKLSAVQPWQQQPTQNQERVTVNDLLTVDSKDLQSLGFVYWDNNLMLLPLWSLGVIKFGEQLVCINGVAVKVGVDIIDTDTRGGCLAYGFVHPGLAANEDTKDAA